MFTYLQSHPEVIHAAKDALDKYGAGLGSVRFICGTQVGTFSQCTTTTQHQKQQQQHQHQKQQQRKYAISLGYSQGA